MQALLDSEPDGARTPLKRWLRHGRPSLERMADAGRGPRLSGRAPADEVEQLCLTNVVQQLEHLRAHDSVAQALRAGTLELHGMYFHVGEAQAYLLDEGDGAGLFGHVGAVDELRPRDGRWCAARSARPRTTPDRRRPRPPCLPSQTPVSPRPPFTARPSLSRPPLSPSRPDTPGPACRCAAARPP